MAEHSHKSCGTGRSYRKHELYLTSHVTCNRMLSHLHRQQWITQILYLWLLLHNQMLSKIACHVLSHFATQANLYWHPQRIWECPTLGGRAKVVEVAPPPAP